MSVRLNLEGDHGQISAEMLHAALGDVLNLLHEAAVVAEVDVPEWRISGLTAASAHIAIAAPEESPISEVVRVGIDALRRVAAIPDGWTRQMVKLVLDLGRRAGTGGTTEISLGLGPVRVAPRVLNAIVVDHAQQALGAATASYGSIRGKVDRWNEHGKREIGLSREFGPAVSGTYSDGLRDRVRHEALGQDIEVWGVIRRNVMGQITSMTIEDFTVLEAPERVSIVALAGAYRTEEPFTLADWLADRHE